MTAAAEACRATARRYLVAADHCEHAGQIALADTLGGVAAAYLAVALQLEEQPHAALPPCCTGVLS